MSENLAAKRLLDLIPAIMRRWDQRVRAEVSQRRGPSKSFFATAFAGGLRLGIGFGRSNYVRERSEAGRRQKAREEPPPPAFDPAQSAGGD